MWARDRDFKSFHSEASAAIAAAAAHFHALSFGLATTWLWRQAQTAQPVCWSSTFGDQPILFLANL